MTLPNLKGTETIEMCPTCWLTWLNHDSVRERSRQSHTSILRRLNTRSESHEPRGSHSAGCGVTLHTLILILSSSQRQGVEEHSLDVGQEPLQVSLRCPLKVEWETHTDRQTTFLLPSIPAWPVPLQAMVWGRTMLYRTCLPLSRATWGGVGKGSPWSPWGLQRLGDIGWHHTEPSAHLVQNRSIGGSLPMQALWVYL
jgi:hypothetical protein